MKDPQKKLSLEITYIKYFLSYLLILTVLLAGFFVIIRNQLTSRYFNQRSKQALMQLDHFADQLDSDILYLTQIDTAFSTDKNLLMVRHKQEQPYIYLASSQLKKYVDISKLVTSIVYLPRKTGTPITSQYNVSYRDGIFGISHLSSEYDPIMFDPAPYLGASNGQLIFLSDEGWQILLYFPPLKQDSAYLFFYIMDINGLTQQLNGLISQEITSVALVDGNSRIVTGKNTAPLLPYLQDMQLVDGIHKLDSATSLCVHTDINNGFSVVATLSNDFLTEQVNQAFASSYLLLLLLGIAGFSLIFLAMRFTYQPLSRLTRKLISDPDPRKSYVNQIDSVFSETENQIRETREKLNNYRLSMEKSLLDSMVSPEHADSDMIFPIIDRLFEKNLDKEIYILRVASLNSELSSDSVRSYFQASLNEKTSCCVLNFAPESTVMLIYTDETEPDLGKELKEICDRFHEVSGYVFAISSGCHSPMEIPSLYEDIIHAGNYWPHIPVVELSSLPPTAYAYPQVQLDYLSELLADNNFPAVRMLIMDLFRLVNTHTAPENSPRNFFVRSILVDMLTILTNHMNLSYINFQSYSDLYFETLYYCRSCPYAEKEALIIHNIGKLVDLCEEEITRKHTASAPLMQLMEQSYCQSDFSIYTLADELHVSVSHVSYLFKKELNTNFSDLLWDMRVKKAKELMLNTDMTMEEISLAVGYASRASFCRKFKKETGMLPSEFKEHGVAGG